MTDDERKERLLSTAMQVDVIELAGRIVAHPARNAPAVTTAGAVALAYGVERFWEIALEAEVLARLIDKPRVDDDPARGWMIEDQASKVMDLMNALRGLDEKETDDGQ